MSKNTNTALKINKIQPTDEKITGRAGMSLFKRYSDMTGICDILAEIFGDLRKSEKGVEVNSLCKQVLCYFMEGDSLTLTRFDELKKDEAYAGIIEMGRDEMVSSHSVKRFFRKIGYRRIWRFRGVLQDMFVWRLKVEKPKMIILNIDTMVMNNDDARKREGVKVTYKGVKGFQPLQMTWGPYIIDAVFRSGDKHSNNKDTVIKMVRHIVKRIRELLGEEVVIILRSDSGFFDEENFKAFEEMGIGYVCVGKMYKDIKGYVDSVDRGEFRVYGGGEDGWEYIEFGDRRGVWEKFRRTIYTRGIWEGRQMLFDFARVESVIYTNLGVDKLISERLKKIGEGKLMEAESIIEIIHGRGKDELVHRALKEFGTERMPFERFESNAVFYYMMLIAFFLYEAFKRDVAGKVIDIGCYAETFRRRIIDIGAKIVKSGREVIVKIHEAIYKQLRIGYLWMKSNTAPPIYTS